MRRFNSVHSTFHKEYDQLDGADLGHQGFPIEKCLCDYSDHLGCHMGCCQWKASKHQNVHETCQFWCYFECVHHLDGSHVVVLLKCKLDVNFQQTGSRVVHQIHVLSEFALT